MSITEPKIKIGLAETYAIPRERGVVTYNGTVLEITVVNLALYAPGDVTVFVQWLFRDSNGGLNVMRDSFVVPVDNLTRQNSVVKQYPLALGTLVSAMVTCNSIVLQVWASIRVRYSPLATAPIIAALATGYCGNDVAVVYPGGGITQYDSLGVLIHEGANPPAAGAEWSFHLPYRVALAIHSVRFKFVTAAGGGNRTVFVFREQLTREWWLADHTQAGGLTHYYCFHYQSGIAVPVVATINEEHLSAPVLCAYEDIFGIGADGLAAGDQFSEIEFTGYLMQCDS